MLVSFVLYFVISDFPEEVTWLNEEEKEFVKARLYEDVGHSKRHEPLTFKNVLNVLKDCKSCVIAALSLRLKALSGKIIVGGFMYFGLIVPAYGYG